MNSETTSSISSLLAAVVAAYDLPKMDSSWDSTYDVAAVAAVAAIEAALAEVIPTLTISCTAADHDSPEEMGGGLYSDYTVDLTIGEQTKTIGGWMVCGWIQSGASADLDGSGLANWGSSQPGGWSCCDSDGATRGNLSVSHDDYSITIEPGYGRAGKMVLTIAGLLGLTPEEQSIITEHLELNDYLAALVHEIESVVESIDRGVSEPSDEEVWDELASGTEVVEDAVRVGSWGDYPLVAVRYGDDYTSHQSGDDDWQRDVRRAAANHAEAEVARLLAKMDDQD
jgi:hypothetical protein